MNALIADVRYALRGLKSGVLVTALCVISLAFAVLGNVIVFSIISGLFFRPMPYHEPTRLVMIGERAPGDTSAVPTAAASNFLDWRVETGSFSGLAAFKQRTLNLGQATAERGTSGAAVTPEFFAVLGRQAAIGRVFTAQDGRPGEHRVVVLDHRFWQQHFGGAPSVVGQEIRVDAELHTVIGVLPEDFDFLSPNVHVWAPLVIDPVAARRDVKDLLVIGRLREQASMQSATQEVQSRWQQLTEQYPRANQGYDITLLNMRDDIPDARNRQVFALMQGAMLFVLLIACGNIANLLLARGERRRGEIALRAVLGASRGRIIRQLITESVVLAALGGALGLALAAVGVRLLTSALAAALPSFFSPVIDARVMLFLLGVTALSALLFGLAPSLAVRPDLATALKEEGRSSSRSRRLLGRAFVVSEIAAALVLLAGAGMLTEAFLRVQTASPGFDINHLMAADLALPETRYGEDRKTRAVYEDLVATVEQAPGVRGASVVSRVPRSPAQPRAPFSIDGSPLTAGEERPHTIWVAVSPGYARVLGVTVTRGRFFDATDRDDSVPVAVISASLASRYFPNAEAVGRSLTVLERKRTIVGVLPDVRQELTLGVEGSQLAVYVPAAQHPMREMTLLVRATNGASGLAETLRSTVREIDPVLPQPQLLSLDEYQSRFFAGAQVLTSLLGGFGSLALFLAALGTYGIVAYSVNQRTREIGLRMALGARPGQVVGLIALEALKLASVGVLIGVPGVVLLGTAVRTAMTGISTVSPLSLTVAIGVLCASLLLACLVPAVRASRLDPTEALRAI